MVPNIEVKDAKGKLIQTYEIFTDNSITGYGPLITNEHLFKMAKLNAIEDGLVSEDLAHELTFSVAE
jgi:hypothetical protein|tara:strand:+ start:474 stop:674 length:201 start_codon:yes stop_codon:yes gene_type:complete